MRKVLIIESPYYEHVVAMLREGAIEVLEGHGRDYEIEQVPGALEIPAALNMLQKTGRYDAYIILGCVIRGETSHYDIVCNESARGVYDLVAQHNLALGNAVLTVENEQQAIDRADKVRKNKGADAANAALSMLDLKQRTLS